MDPINERARLLAGNPLIAVGTGTTILLVEIVLLVVYFEITGLQSSSLLSLIVPWIWINASLFGLYWRFLKGPIQMPSPTVTAIAGGYFLVLSYAGGLVAPASGTATGFSVQMLAPPGWGPMLIADTSLLQVTIIPYKFVGYLTLAVLVGLLLAEASGSIAGGIVGLFSCVSCTWPLLGGLLAALTGGSVGVISGALAFSLEVSTILFLSAVGLLCWRPKWPL